jgi:hypothetical protein
MDYAVMLQHHREYRTSDAKRFTVSEGGIVVIPPGYCFSAGA